MHPLDLEIFTLINQFAGKNSYFDGIIIFVSANHMFKGGVFVLLMWFLWFKKGDKKVFRPLILINLVGCFLAMFIARIMAKFLPFRMRPIHSSSIDLSMPIGLEDSYAEGLSSFPSDHAALFFALATGVYFLNKKLGVFTLLYAFLIICMPRIYLGLHYPSDIVAGALLGVIIVILVHKLIFFRHLNAHFFKFKKTYPSIFYAIFFLVTYQIADMFESVRAIMKFSYFVIIGGEIEL